MNNYIAINGIGYVVLGLACALLPFKTAEMVGFTLNGGKGLAEYLAVYGGLEVAMGMFFLSCLRRPNLHYAALLFGTWLYAALVLFRVGGMLAFGVATSDLGWVLCGLEVLFLIWSVVLMKTRSPSTSSG